MCVSEQMVIGECDQCRRVAQSQARGAESTSAETLAWKVNGVKAVKKPDRHPAMTLFACYVGVTDPPSASTACVPCSCRARFLWSCRKRAIWRRMVGRVDGELTLTARS